MALCAVASPDRPNRAKPWHQAMVGLIFCAFVLTGMSAAFADTVTLTTLYSLGPPTGYYPTAGVVQGNDGNFYGTTTVGGSFGRGTVFSITPAGSLTTLYSFSGADGDYPAAALVSGSDGNLYGTTYYGGANDAGTVFKISTTGSLTTLHSFGSSDGANPQGSLVQGSDGSFYGTTLYGGSTGMGTVFRITVAGALTRLYSFGSSGGSYPYAGLAPGSDGNFYGTTFGGGMSNVGTVFKITPAGTFTSLHSFAGTDGGNPYAGLVQSSDGYFYGTTSIGGTSGDGTAFKITATGTLTSLHSFDGKDGANPYAAMVQGSDGTLYGTTEDGAQSGTNSGTIYSIATNGTFTLLHSFLGYDGNTPQGGLIQGSDGSFYGTTFAGGEYEGVNNGLYDYGSVYKMQILQSPPTAPSHLIATAKSGHVNLRWSSSHRESAITYNVYAGTAPGAESATPVKAGLTQPWTVLSGLSSGGTYYFKVAAVNTGGTSALSSEASVTVSNADSSGH